MPPAVYRCAPAPLPALLPPRFSSLFLSVRFDPRSLSPPLARAPAARVPHREVVSLGRFAPPPFVASARPAAALPPSAPAPAEPAAAAAPPSFHANACLQVRPSARRTRPKSWPLFQTVVFCETPRLGSGEPSAHATSAGSCLGAQRSYHSSRHPFGPAIAPPPL